ncbi:MAG: PAS domain-containing protein, partial [Polyangiaceae bacterium]
MVGGSLERAARVKAALGSFFVNARVPVIVVEPSGQLVSANDAALAQYGYSLGEMAAMHIRDFMAGPRPELPADLAHATRGDPGPLDRRPHRRKDGSVLWVVPVAGPQIIEGATLIVSTLQDVTAVVTAEQRASVEHDRVEVLWEGAVERFGGSFALLGADRVIVRVNRKIAEWTARREEDIVGKRCDQVFLGRCTRQPCPHAIALAERPPVVEEVVSTHGK